MEVLDTGSDIVRIETRDPEEGYGGRLALKQKVPFGPFNKPPRVLVSVVGLSANINPPQGNLNYRLWVDTVERDGFTVKVSHTDATHVNYIDITYTAIL